MLGIAGQLTLSPAPKARDQVHQMLGAMPRRGHRMELLQPNSLLTAGICSLENPRLHLAQDAGSFAFLHGQCYSGLEESEDNQAHQIRTGYRQHGRQFFHRLNGEFAVALWDAEAVKLILVRDSFGTKPLFFYRGNDRFAFASDLKALAMLPAIRPRPNRLRIAEYFLDGLEGVDHLSTFYEGIFRVPAGTTMEVTVHSIATYPHWRPQASSKALPIFDTEATSEFASILEAAVSSRANGPQQTGVLLSGGLDSATIAGILAAQSSTPPQTFSLVSNDSESACEESNSIRKLQQSLRIEHHSASPDELAKSVLPLPELISQLNNPFSATLLGGPIPLYRMARSHGLNQVLDGVDGDLVGSLTGNYQWFIANEDSITVALREMLAEARRYGELPTIPLKATRFVAKRCLHRMISRNNPVRRFLRHRHSDRSRETRLKSKLLKTSFVKDLPLAERIRIQSENEYPYYPQTNSEACAQTLLSPHIPAAMERYEDAGALFGVDVSHPFLDRRVVEFSLALPWNCRVRQGVPKWLLRQAAAPYLPEAIVAQYKLANIGHRCLASIDRTYLTSHPKPPSWLTAILEDFIEIDTLRHEWEAASNSEHYGGSEMIGPAIVMAEWLRTHF